MIFEKRMIDMKNDAMHSIHSPKKTIKIFNYNLILIKDFPT